MLRRRSLGFAAIGLGMAIAIYQFAPSLAENISNALAISTSEDSSFTTKTDTDVTESETSVSLLGEDSNSARTDVTVSLESEGGDTNVAQSPIRRVPPPELTTTQAITIRVPQSVRVDPRAQSVFLPQIYAESLNTLMICLSSDSLLMDIGSQGLEDSIDSDVLKVSGDRSAYLVISGDPETVISVLNGVAGIRAFRSSGGVANQNLAITLVDLSRPSLDTGFCERPAGGNRRIVTFAPLALEQRITDGKIRLGK